MVTKLVVLLYCVERILSSRCDIYMWQVMDSMWFLSCLSRDGWYKKSSMPQWSKNLTCVQHTLHLTKPKSILPHWSRTFKHGAISLNPLTWYCDLVNVLYLGYKFFIKISHSKILCRPHCSNYWWIKPSCRHDANYFTTFFKINMDLGFLQIDGLSANVIF